MLTLTRFIRGGSIYAPFSRSGRWARVQRAWADEQHIVYRCNANNIIIKQSDSTVYTITVIKYRVVLHCTAVGVNIVIIILPIYNNIIPIIPIIPLIQRPPVIVSQGQWPMTVLRNGPRGGYFRKENEITTKNYPESTLYIQLYIGIMHYYYCDRNLTRTRKLKRVYGEISDTADDAGVSLWQSDFRMN